MPTPDFILDLRRHIGHLPLWLPGVTAVVLREGDACLEVLCAQRADNRRWGPVTGIVEPGEEPHLTAVREALEETGVVIEVEKLVWVEAMEPVTYDNGDVCLFLDHTFRCRYVSGEAHVADDESCDVAWFPVDALPEPMREVDHTRIAIAVADPPQPLLGRDAAPPSTRGR